MQAKNFFKNKNTVEKPEGRGGITIENIITMRKKTHFLFKLFKNKLVLY